MTATHTDGPWRVYNNELPDNPESWTVIAENGRHVCGFFRLRDGCQDQQALDAYLIKEAPSLLAVVRELVEDAEAHGYSADEYPLIRKATEIIARTSQP